MNISLTWNDLVKLAANCDVEKDGVTLTVDRHVLPDLEISANGISGFVRFSLDESDPRSKPYTEIELPGGVTYVNNTIPRPKRKL
jgi:hypothetical protein